MYLKSLTMKGFKSFASSTTLQFEPGITCIVGPNGSGKSNVVDALAWVMGEQGAKSLRGGKMEDVIFAGTSGRPPLGRAEVQLTIDNTDGALPIEYSEVTISRTMFRNGGSEYAINGQHCRLLDVQELLSDSGIGREMHVIVGQGQLDSILHATPEDRRGFIEEAAGVLKHRKRKEKALRKLDATEGNLTRLADLINEIRRQLKPLGRQAEVARKAAVVQSDLRDAKARLMADDLVTARTAMEQEIADESILLERRAEVEALIGTAREEESALEAALREDLPALARAQETWFSLSGLRDRIRGTQSLAQERVRNAADVAAPLHSDRDPDELEARAAEFATQEQTLLAEVEQLREALAVAVERRQQAETAYGEEERRVAGLQRAAADRREGLARLTGQLNGLRSQASGAEAEVGRLVQAREAALARGEQATNDYTALESRIAGLDAGEEGLDAEHESATTELSEAEEQLAALRDQLTAAEQHKAAIQARKEALEMGLNRKDGAGALLAAAGSLKGVLGSVAALVAVRPGYEAAIAGALGSAADAVVAADPDAAVGAIGHLKSDDLGRAGMVLGGAPVADGDWPGLPGSATYAIDVVEAPSDLRGALTRLLFKVAVVSDLSAARDLVTQLPDVVAVTRDGDLFGAHFAAGGSHSVPSLIEVQAAVDEATDALQRAVHDVERLTFETQAADQRRHVAVERVEGTLSRLHESDAALAAVAEELAQYGATARSAKGEAERLQTQIEAATAAREQAVAGLADLESRLATAQEAPDEEPDTAQRELLGDQAREARQGELDARLRLRTAEERGRALQGRADQLRAAAQAERDARAAALARRARLEHEGRVGAEVAAVADVVLQRLDHSIHAAALQRSQVEESRSGREHKLRAVREDLRTLGAELDELINSAHRDEMARTQQKMRIEAIAERALEELGLDIDALVGDYGPETMVPTLLVSEDGGEPTFGEPVPYDREAQAKRLRAAERALAMLGRVNPLALEEFSALEERHRFLTEQLEDLKKTRRDLLDIITEVDERVEQVFTQAYRDVEVAFADVFKRLFPGGEGRLILTDESDMLRTGVEVEARPPGKKVKRLSLLSGGERSLVAVAFLVALFKARPSPFYILDEVEAALDDTNLGRLLEIYEELRENSQLLVITHQKRTMEVGDALYGVSMRGDGVSAVISQRLRDAS